MGITANQSCFDMINISLNGYLEGAGYLILTEKV